MEGIDTFHCSKSSTLEKTPPPCSRYRSSLEGAWNLWRSDRALDRVNSSYIYHHSWGFRVYTQSFLSGKYSHTHCWATDIHGNMYTNTARSWLWISRIRKSWELFPKMRYDSHTKKYFSSIHSQLLVRRNWKYHTLKYLMYDHISVRQNNSLTTAKRTKYLSPRVSWNTKSVSDSRFLRVSPSLWAHVQKNALCKFWHLILAYARAWACISVSPKSCDRRYWSIQNDSQ